MIEKEKFKNDLNDLNSVEFKNLPPKKKNLVPEYRKRKAEAVKEYLNSNKTTREIQKEYWIDKAVISVEVRKEIKGNRNYYNNTLEETRFIISKNNIKIINSLDKVKIKDLDDLVKITDVNLKAQKLINIIENAQENQEWNLPSNINIQIINK